MRAEILDTGARFTVQPAERSDGTLGAPLVLTARPCWRKPALTLMLAWEAEGVAYYAVAPSAPPPRPEQHDHCSDKQDDDHRGIVAAHG